MALDERTRHALHQRLDEVLGPEHAVAAMSAYPGPGEELATRSDVAAVRSDVAAVRSDLGSLEERMTMRMESMLHREIHQAITAQTRTVLFGLIGTVMATGGSIVAAAVALAR